MRSPKPKNVLGVSKTTFAQAVAMAKEKVKDGKPFSVELEIEKDKSDRRSRALVRRQGDESGNRRGER